MKTRVSQFAWKGRLGCSTFILFGFAVYQCWQARNARIHLQEYATPTIIAMWVLESASRSATFPTQANWDTTRPSRPSSTLWCPPHPGWLKINIDGALLPSCQAGLAIEVRDSSGTVLFAAGRSLMQWDPGRTEMAALAAIRDYLKVDCFDASGVIIEGDCLNLIKYCQRCFDSRLWDAHFPDADVLGFLFELPRVLFRYAPRETNRAAYFCSRYAISCTFLCTYFEDFTSVLSEIV
ncbi:hypothetical protein KSP40_PGU016083 [Platanthera guangdongensis]|uniref:RNase H type-1 domain-containing protein n=1 Tax=Platanthera guangdongensis TaxID=2320717 RepID=A0ABR2LTD5_9ASPA